MKDASPRFAANDLIDAATGILEAVGVPREGAQTTADCLVFAELRGIQSHGLIRLRFYVDRIRAGGIKTRPSPRAVHEGLGTALLDADNALGPVGGRWAMTIALEKAGKNGVGLVVVRNLNHYGTAAYYAVMALERRMIGASMTNVVASMAPTGGSRPVVGNNPLAFAFPARDADAIVFDAATSQSSWGALTVARQQGRPLPLGPFLGPDGQPSDDAEAVLDGGSLAPIAGYKGYGLALTISLLTGVLGDWKFDTEITHPYRDLAAPGDNAALMLAIDVEQFAGADRFAARADEVVRAVQAVPAIAQGGHCLLPGQREAEAAAANLADGIPLSGETLTDVRGLAADLGVVLPLGA